MMTCGVSFLASLANRVKLWNSTQGTPLLLSRHDPQLLVISHVLIRRGYREVPHPCMRQDAETSSRCVGVANKRHGRYSHPQPIASGCAAVVWKGIQRDINPMEKAKVICAWSVGSEFEPLGCYA